MKRQQRVAVAGGGMGGLAVGLLLQRAGYDATIYEQADELNRIGAGINIFANGMHVLRAAGAAEELMAVGSIPHAWHSREWDTGKLLFAHPQAEWTQRYGESHIILHRGDLQNSLARQLKPGSLVFQKLLVGIDEIADGLRVRFGDGTNADVDLVVGADGVNSRVRELILGPEKPKYTGVVAYRSIFPTSRLAYPLETEGCKFWSDERHWAQEDRHFIIYYTTKDKKETYFVTGSPDPNWEGELPVEVTIKEVKDHYDGFHHEVQRVIDASIKITKWPFLVREPLPLWSSGRIVLLGDACHPMKPHMGQGAGMAFEDAAILVRCLQAKPDDYDAAFKLYAANRQERTARVQKISYDNTWCKYPEDPTWCFGYNAMTVPLVPVTQSKSPAKTA